MNRLRAIPAGLVLAAAAEAGAADAQATFLREVRADPAVKNAFLQAAGFPQPEHWDLESVRFKLTASAIRLQMNPRLEFVTSHEIVNCEDTAVTQAITLSKEVSNKVSTSVSQTLEHSDELKLSFEYEGLGAGWTGAQKHSVSLARATEQTSTTKIEETTTVGFDKRGGRISVLQAMRIEAREVPWTANVAPNDDERIEVTAKWKAASRVCLYEHASYGGREACFDAPQEQARLGLKMNNKVSSIRFTGPGRLTVYRFVNFGGDAKAYAEDTPNVGAEWNDRISSFRFEKAAATRSPRFAAVKASIPESKRRFVAKGTISVSETRPDGKRITNYGVTPADLDRACAASPGLAAAAADTRGGARPAGRGIVRRELPPDEAMRRIAAAPKL